MNHNTSLFATSDYPPPSMSEFDSLSDSDWLDISSSRESDDDSVISGDSDREEGVLMPLSRRSSMSVGSSREGDVEAWEGFVDDSGDEDTRNSELGTHQTASTAGVSENAGAAPVVDAQQELTEEERVKEALDQSLISTLSSSRSSTASSHNSIRDLRLSFPDPLTSSHNELNRSYEDVSPSETSLTATDVAIDNVAGAGEGIRVLPAVPLCKEDLGSFITTPEVTEQVVKREVRVYQGDSKAEFEVVLYGSPSSVKWSFVQDLVQKAVAASGRTVTGTTACANDSIRYLHLERQIDHTLSIFEFVAVYDRTDDAMASDALVPRDSKRPSLAILYLPSVIHSLPEHTLYLPVTSSSAESNSTRITAEHDWNSLAIPDNKIAHLSKDAASPIFDCRNIGEVSQMLTHRLLQRLISDGNRKRPTRAITEHLSPVHAVTLFALVSIVVGFAMNTGFHKPFTPTPTSVTPASTTFLGMFSPEVNRTAIFPATARINAPVVSTSRDDYSLSIYNPGTTSLVLTSQSKQAISNVPTTPEVTLLTSDPRKDKKQSVDVIVRPTAQLSSIETIPSVTTTSSPLSNMPSGTKTTGFVESLSEVLDIHVKTLRSDLDELVESLDELARALRRQTKVTIQQSKGKAKEIRETVQYRHERARGKAKELKKKGEVIVSSAGEQLIERTDIAKKKAREISKNLVASDAWRVYQAAQAEWASVLKEKGGGSHRGSCKDGAQTLGRRGKIRRVNKVKAKQTKGFFSYAEVFLA